MAGPLNLNPIPILTRTLDALALRQEVAASNVANAETPGFQASAVRFEDILQRALALDPNTLPLSRTNARHLLASGVDPTQIEPVVVEETGTRVRSDGNNVDIEREMGLLAETTVRYEAVSETLARRLAILRLIASEGRG